MNNDSDHPIFDKQDRFGILIRPKIDFGVDCDLITFKYNNQSDTLIYPILLSMHFNKMNSNYLSRRLIILFTPDI